MKARQKRKLAKKDEAKLIVLCYANNECYTDLLSVGAALKKFGKYFGYQNGKWVWTGSGRFEYGANGEFPVGKSRRIPRGQKYGVIGVYRQDDLSSLNSMLRTAQAATEHELSDAFGD